MAGPRRDRPRRPRHRRERGRARWQPGRQAGEPPRARAGAPHGSLHGWLLAREQARRQPRAGATLRLPRLRGGRSADPPRAMGARGAHASARARRALGTDRRRGRVAPERKREPPAHPSHRSEEHTSELQSRSDLVCRLLLEKKKEKSAVFIYSAGTTIISELSIDNLFDIPSVTSHTRS